MSTVNGLVNNNNSPNEKVEFLSVSLVCGIEKMLYTGQIVFHNAKMTTANSPDDNRKPPTKTSPSRRRKPKNRSTLNTSPAVSGVLGTNEGFKYLPLQPKISTASNQPKETNSKESVFYSNELPKPKAGLFGLTETFSPIGDVTPVFPKPKDKSDVTSSSSRHGSAKDETLSSDKQTHDGVQNSEQDMSIRQELISEVTEPDKENTYKEQSLSVDATGTMKRAQHPCNVDEKNVGQQAFVEENTESDHTVGRAADISVDRDNKSFQFDKASGPILVENRVRRVVQQADLKEESSNDKGPLEENKLDSAQNADLAKAQSELISRRNESKCQQQIRYTGSACGFPTFPTVGLPLCEETENTAKPTTEGEASPRVKASDDLELRQTLRNAQKCCCEAQKYLVETMYMLGQIDNPEEHLNDDCEPTERESLNEEFQTLAMIFESLKKFFNVQVEVANSMRSIDSGFNSSGIGSVENAESTQSNPQLFREDKEDLLVQCRSLMNRTPMSKNLVCTYIADPFSSDLRYSCCDDRVYGATDSFLCFCLPHGEGILQSTSGDLVYEGQWKYGKRWGQGKAFILSGSELSAIRKDYGIYQGSWWNNMRHGYGRQVFASGSEYGGEWTYDLISGVGTMNYSDGSSFHGDWDDNMPDGCGMFAWPDGYQEYREYRKGEVLRVVHCQGELSKRSAYVQTALQKHALLTHKYQSVSEANTQLLQNNLCLKETLQRQEREIEARVTNLEEKLKQARQQSRKIYFSKKMEVENFAALQIQLVRDNYEEKIKILEDKIKGMEVASSGSLCQICFDNKRDCILMPCTHMMYCRRCISKEKEQGRNRCPTCRSLIEREINCSVFE